MFSMDTGRKAVQKRLERFRERCAAAHLAQTPQRQAIYELLAADSSHPTAEDVFSRLRPKLPSLSLGTVYRTIDMLVKLGLLQRVTAGSGESRFDADVELHGHLVCMHCSAVFDFHAKATSAPSAAAKRTGFRIVGQQWHAHGICRECRKSSPGLVNIENDS
jgi:Fe2+ or Zn2+ uptake regulation protein